MPKLPVFQTDEEEAEFWDTHSTADYWDEMDPVSDVTMSAPGMPQRLISLPLSQTLFTEIKRIADERGIPYERLVRQWLTERVKEEHRKAS